MYNAHYLSYFLQSFKNKTGIKDLTWKEMGKILRFMNIYSIRDSHEKPTGLYSDTEIYRLLNSRSQIDTIKNYIDKLRNGTLYKPTIPISQIQPVTKPTIPTYKERPKTSAEIWQEKQYELERKEYEERQRRKREFDIEMMKASQELLDEDN